MGKTGTSGVKISAKALISKEINWFYERYIQYSIPGHHLSGAWGLMVIHFLFLMLSRLIDYVLWFTDKAIYQIGLELDKVKGKMMVHGKKG